jgi:hypothetical protein
LPQGEIQKVIRAHFKEFRACYDAGLKREPTLEGRIQLRFVISREGTVIQVTDTGELKARAPEVSSCAIEVMSALVFPKPDGGIVTVVYPIAFALTE